MAKVSTPESRNAARDRAARVGAVQTQATAAVLGSGFVFGMCYVAGWIESLEL